MKGVIYYLYYAFEMDPNCAPADCVMQCYRVFCFYTPRNEVRGGGGGGVILDSPCLSVRLSVC